MAHIVIRVNLALAGVSLVRHAPQVLDVDYTDHRSAAESAVQLGRPLTQPARFVIRC